MTDSEDTPKSESDSTAEDGKQGDDESPKSFDELTDELLKLLRKNSDSDTLIFSSKIGLKDDSESDTTPAVETAPKKPVSIKFNMTPKEVKAHLDQYVIKQDQAKVALSIAICDHYNHIKRCIDQNYDGHYTKQNIVMIGPTGVGKTFLVKCISELIGVPFVKSDATKFTETGYVGGDVEDLVRGLVKKADDNIDLAQYGIIYLDEIDKITSGTNKLGRDVSGRGVQSNLLKLMEDTDVPLKTPWDINSQIRSMMGGDGPKQDTINTRNILFIVSGAFDSLDDLVKKRVQGSQYGFDRGERQDRKALFDQVSTQDLVDFGLEPEFVGRLPVRVICDELEIQDLEDILRHSKVSILDQYIAAFEAYGIYVHFTDDALTEIASLAHAEKTGARGLSTVFERTFRHFKFELPSTSVCYLVVTKALVDNPEAELARLLNTKTGDETAYFDARISLFTQEYMAPSGHRVSFSPEIVPILIQQSKDQQVVIDTVCAELTRRLEDTLRLLPTTSPVVITSEMLASIAQLDGGRRDGLSLG